MVRNWSHWTVFRPWERHGLVLIVGGCVYVFTGLTFMFADDFTPARHRSLVVAINIMPLTTWGFLFFMIGVVAMVSSRWPSFWDHSKGYMLLSGLASGWSAVYFLGFLLGEAPKSNLNYGTLWGLMAFMWWAVSGLYNPPKRVRTPHGPD